MRQFYVYILASESRTLYVGITSNLLQRMHQHRNGSMPSFTQRHEVTRLVYFETTANSIAAITREKQLKRWPRWRKVRLIERENAGWNDLAAAWFPDERRVYQADGIP